MNKMKSTVILSLLGLSSAYANTDNFEAFAGVTSDYVFRGVSQSGEDPAIQAGLKFRPAKDWFVRGFVSEVESPFGGDIEIELAGGYEGSFNPDFSYQAELVYSIFTDENGQDSDYAEAIFSVEYKKFIKATLAHTTDFYGSSDAGTYAEARFNLPLHDVIKTAAYAGYYSLDDGAGESYALIGFDAWTYIGDIELKLGFSDTDIDGNDNADSRIFVNARYHF